MEVKSWDKSPIKVEFGEGMVMTDVAIDNNHTLTLYTEKKMADKYNFFVTISPKPKEITTLVDELDQW